KKQINFLNALKKADIPEAVFLTTCNRTEVYGVGNVYEALDILSGYSKSDVGIKNNVLIFDGENAIRHLFRVACGIESMVVGEDEILGQIKNAFAFSQKNGLTGYELNTVFKAAITSVKKIKTQTLISKSSVSVATLVAAKCRKFSGKTVLMLGASGEIGGKVLKNLLSYGEFEIYATTREGHISNDNLTVISYAQRYDYTDKADIVISATKSPHFTIVSNKLKEHISASKPRLFIDLAVPRDIDGDIKHIPNITLMQIDDFNDIAKQNSEIKRCELKTAQDLMNEDIDTLLKELSFHSVLPKIQSIADDKIKHFIYNFRDTANAKEFESFINVFSQMEDIL
ncbi:MAG: glutamyl-tRNA reductase, partial [Eubacterium sp.]